MSTTVADYVERRDGNIYVGSSRVTLESIILLWRGGQRPEEILEGFPTLSLAAIYGSIAYYLEHQEELDVFLRQNAEMRQRQRAEAEAADPVFYASMRARFAEASQRGEAERDATVEAPNARATSGDALLPSKP